MRDDTKHATEAKDDTHLTVKEELIDTTTKAIERIKIGANKICIREDLAKEKNCVQPRIHQCHCPSGQCGTH